MRERPFQHDPGVLAPSRPWPLPALALPPGVLADPGAGEDRQVPRRGRRSSSNPSIEHNGRPATITDPGAPSMASGPATRQNSCSSGHFPSRRRHTVIVLRVETCHLLAHGSRGSSPVSARITSG